MADAERIDEAVEGDVPPGLDRLEQVVHRLGAVALLLRQPLLLRQAMIAPGEREAVGGLHDAALLGLRRSDEAAGAAAHDVDAARALVRLAHGRAAAGGADMRELVGPGAR